MAREASPAGSPPPAKRRRTIVAQAKKGSTINVYKPSPMGKGATLLNISGAARNSKVTVAQGETTFFARRIHTRKEFAGIIVVSLNYYYEGLLNDKAE